jgi:hypothetical protein
MVFGVIILGYIAGAYAGSRAGMRLGLARTTGTGSMVCALAGAGLLLAGWSGFWRSLGDHASDVAVLLRRRPRDPAGHGARPRPISGIAPAASPPCSASSR